MRKYLTSKIIVALITALVTISTTVGVAYISTGEDPKPIEQPDIKHEAIQGLMDGIREDYDADRVMLYSMHGADNVGPLMYFTAKYESYNYGLQPMAHMQKNLPIIHFTDYIKFYETEEVLAMPNLQEEKREWLRRDVQYLNVRSHYSFGLFDRCGEINGSFVMNYIYKTKELTKDEITDLHKRGLVIGTLNNR